MLTAKDYFNHLDIITQPNSMTTVGKFDSQPTLKYAEMDRQSLPIPKMLSPVSEEDNSVHYHITAQEGKTEYFPGIKSPSKGYN